MKLPDYLRVRSVWKGEVQDIPLVPADILVDDVEKTIVKRHPNPVAETGPYLTYSFPPSHHLD